MSSMNKTPHIRTGVHAVMGITGQVGGAAARALLQAGKRVRGIVRDKAKASAWERQGVELAEADWSDAGALEAAFRGTEGAFVMVPPYFAPAPGYPEVTAVARAVRRALDAVRLPRVVAVSSVGAHRSHGLGIITQCRIFEETLAGLASPHAFLRAAWFMDNFQWDVPPAREKGEIASFLAPLDRKHPMVGSPDIGVLIARTLGQDWTGRRVLELEGPARYSPNDAAEAFSQALSRPVTAKVVARERWAALFEAQGTAPDRTALRIEMLDGFNSGWIDFEGGAAERVQGATTLKEAVHSFGAR